MFRLIVQTSAIKFTIITSDKRRRVTKGGRGERSPQPFFENWKKVPQFGEKNALIVVIYG